MKTKLSTLKALIALASLVGIARCSRAQTDALPPSIAALVASGGSVSLVPSDEVQQTSGIFYSSTESYPPAPFDWLPELPVYSVGSNN